MKKNVYPILAGLMLVFAVLACALPGSNSAEQSTTDNVATIVPATFQALTPVSPGSEAPVPAPAGLLPHSLYFLNNDNVGNSQVFRLENDGKTVRQLTFEPLSVETFDVSLVDGSVAYASNRQLLLVNADGTGRRVFAEGGPMDPHNEYADEINSPVFSPDAQTIAYFHKGGLVFYDVSTDVSNVVLEKMVTNPFSGGLGPGELYTPQKYSPDGTKLLVTVAIPNSDGISSGIYYPASDSLVRLSGGDGARLCCTEQGWTSDSSALYVGIPFVGMFGSGLWRMDATTGNITTLLPTEAGGGNYNLAGFPYLAPDGQLYFFFATVTMGSEGFIDDSPLQMIRSGVDAVNGRTVLRPETFNALNEALWAPDASFVIVAKAPDTSGYPGGMIELYYTDATKSVISLLPYGRQLKWGP